MGPGPFFALAVLAGALVAAQGPIYARMAQALGGPVQAALTAFVSAACVLVVLASLGGVLPRAAELRALPLWVWAGGVLGIMVVAISTLAVPRLGAAGYLVALVAGQMLAGALSMTGRGRSACRRGRPRR
jgi:transporter family-2 protein